MSEGDPPPHPANPEVALVLGVDLDGVCADYTTAFRAIAAAELGVELSALPLERSWDFSEWGLSRDQFQELHHRAVTDHRMLRDMPIMEEAAESLWRLSDAGVWIRIITHRLYVNWGHARAIAARSRGPVSGSAPTRACSDTVRGYWSGASLGVGPS